jgi:virginiamycin B lyase
MRTRVAILATAAALAASAVAASGAQAFVYWANFGGQGTAGGSSIGRANLDGSGRDNFFIDIGEISPGLNAFPCGVAVNDTHVFWANQGDFNGTTIGRANIDGTGIDPDFVGGADSPCAPTVDDDFLYWANWDLDTVGRANLDGTSPNQSFIGVSGQACMVAVDPANVFWSNDFTDRIGRTPISGTPVNNDFILAPTGANPCGVAVNSAHIYWANTEDNTIGRANLDGSAVVQDFITGGSIPCGVAVSDTHIYWANLFNRTIGRANLDGTGVNQAFITDTDEFPCGVAVDDRVTPTSTAVSCDRTATAFNQPTACTATVTDTGPAGGATSPDGTVSFASASGGAGFSGSSSCTLSPAGAGSSSCSVTFLPGTGINLLQGFYGGDPEAHEASSGIGQVTVSGFSIGSPALNLTNGTATVTATVPGPGTVNVLGGGIEPASATGVAAGQVLLTLSPDAESTRLLNTTGAADISAVFSYAPQGGGASATQSLSTTLQKKLVKKKKKKRKKKKKKRKKKGKGKGR